MTFLSFDKGLLFLLNCCSTGFNFCIKKSNPPCFEPSIRCYRRGSLPLAPEQPWKQNFWIRFRKPKAYVTAGCGDSTATNILRTAQHSLLCICRTHMSFRPGINSLYPRHLPTHCHLLCFDHCSKQMGWLQQPKSHFCLFLQNISFSVFFNRDRTLPKLFSLYGNSPPARFHFFHKITLYPVFVKKISTFRPQIFNFFVSLFANLML